MEKAEESERTEEARLHEWIRSGEPAKWVSDHLGGWSEDEWLEFLTSACRDPYGPLREDDVKIVVEVFKADFLRRRAEPPSVLAYALGLAIIGLAAGFFAGASSTPIVATLLPLLFALVGGASGLYLATADLSAPWVAWRIGAPGRAIGSFGVACLIGGTIGHSRAPAQR
jgi:hypothetical protein